MDKKNIIEERILQKMVYKFFGEPTKYFTHAV